MYIRVNNKTTIFDDQADFTKRLKRQAIETHKSVDTYAVEDTRMWNVVWRWLWRGWLGKFLQRLTSNKAIIYV